MVCICTYIGVLEEPYPAVDFFKILLNKDEIHLLQISPLLKVEAGQKMQDIFIMQSA